MRRMEGESSDGGAGVGEQVWGQGEGGKSSEREQGRWEEGRGQG